MSYFITYWKEKIIPKTLHRKSESRSWLDISIHEKWCTFSNRIQIADKSHSVTELNVFLYEKKLYKKN